MIQIECYQNIQQVQSGAVTCHIVQIWYQNIKLLKIHVERDVVSTNMTCQSEEKKLDYKFKVGDLIVNIESKTYFLVSKISKSNINLYVTSNKEDIRFIKDMDISKKRLVEQLESDKGREYLRLYKMVPNEKKRKKNNKSKGS